MNEAAKEARRKYVREWQRRNRDKVMAAQARYWERKAQELELRSGEGEAPATDD